VVLAPVSPSPSMRWLADEIIEPVIAAIDEPLRPAQRAN
jgi:hypothetical protein